MRKTGVLIAIAFSFLIAPSAQGAVTDVFDEKIPCAAQPDGTRNCGGPGGDNNAYLATVPSWDGTPIDVNVKLPDPGQFGPGPYPLAMYFHGFGGGKEGFGGDLKRFTDMGMAAFSMTERGFKASCGRLAAINALEAAPPAGYGPGACEDGFIHLMDTRYEVRDAQYLAGILVDEGLVQPTKIASVGASYGGGKTMALATLKNRIMLPDGTLAPWTSPEGVPMELAAGAPIVPWTDFAYALLPNGRTLDYTVDNPYAEPFGVMKSGLISALLPSGDNFSGDSNPPSDTIANPTFDVLGWKALMEQGEPYGGIPLADFMLNEMTKHHSSYYVDDSIEPAPLLIAMGFTDDLFPIDEALRFQNRTRANWPDADVSLLFADIGHPRAPLGGANAQGRPADKELGYQRVEQWFSHYLLGNGSKPPQQVEVLTQKCPYTEPAGGPFTGPSWNAMSPGEVRLADPAVRTIDPASGLQSIAFAFSSISEGCVQQGLTPEPGSITYDFGAVPAGGWTLMGAPTVIADIKVANGGQSQVAARLWEISTDRKQRLIARGVYRPDASGVQVIQLHGNAYRFEPGTRVQLQLLAKDGEKIVPLASYVRPSNDQQPVRVSRAQVRLPVKEKPGEAPGVKKPLPLVLPKGAKLAAEYGPDGSIPIARWSRSGVSGRPVAKGRSLKARISCPESVGPCVAAKFTFRGGPGRKVVIASSGRVSVAPGRTRTVSLKLTGRGRKLLQRSRSTKAQVQVSPAGLSSTRTNVTIRRTGR